MQVTGTITAALPPKEGNSQRGPWKAQDFVIEYADGQYTKRLVFTVFGEERLARFNVQQGQRVQVSFDIDARENNGRWFNSITAYDVRPTAADGYPTPTPPPAAEPAPTVYANDLPF